MGSVSRPLLTQGNEKIGKAIHVWSLPAVVTCPGRTSLCERFCYARKSRFLLKKIRERLEWNLEQAMRDDFVSRMAKEIVTSGVSVTRKGHAG